MKIEIEISDNEIREAVFSKMVERISTEIFNGWIHTTYNRELRAVLREVLAENKEQIINDAVEYASSYISKKGVKKFIENLQEEVEK